ncbi:MAG: sensor domain-containing diguanylate cyclase, partial [Proteobacteria bacterium]|nr:sensor domain-containing diguanylate cyclase [Pseudomonadota bacterium]
LGPHVEVLVDPAKKLGLKDVQSDASSGRWQPYHNPVLLLKDRTAAYWLRFHLNRRDVRPSTRGVWVLELVRPTLEQIDFFIPMPDGSPGGVSYLNRRGGTRVPSNQRDVLPVRNWAFGIPANFDQDRPFYLRIESRFSMNILAQIWTAIGFERANTLDSYVFGGLFGVLAAMVLFNLFLFLGLKDRVYILYVLVSLSAMIFQADLKGHLNLVFGLSSGLHQFLWWFVGGNVIFWGFAFARAFLDTRSFAPRWHRVLGGFMWSGAAVVVLGLAGLPKAANILSQLVGLLSPPVMIVAGLAVYRRGYGAARFFLLAHSLLTLGLYPYVLQGLELVPADRFNTISFTIGAALEALFLAFALADRINVLQREKAAVEKRETLYESLSLTDGLTGLFNKRYLDRRLKTEIEEARRQAQPLSLMMLDLDHFKQFNDHFGHLEGDQVLRTAAEIIRETVRDHDSACRYGGEEFTVILPNAKADQAGNVAERIRVAFTRQTFTPAPGEEARVTISIGLTEMKPEDGDTDLIDRADKALYQAKEAGRNRTVVK